MQLSFLHRIRLKLLNEGKLVRYLTYAFGEILLIVIGILLALKINNWIEDRKAQTEFDNYLLQLQEDVKLAISVCAEEYESAVNKVDREKFLLKKIKGEPIAQEELKSFEKALNGLARTPELSLEFGNLAGLLAGDLKPIARDRSLTLKTMDMLLDIKD